MRRVLDVEVAGTRKAIKTIPFSCPLEVHRFLTTLQPGWVWLRARQGLVSRATARFAWRRLHAGLVPAR